MTWGPYSLAYGAAVLVAMLLAGLGLIQVADAERLGISPIVKEWLGIVSAMLGVLAGALPSWRKPPNEARKGQDL
jgi:hypothetical protein